MLDGFPVETDAELCTVFQEQFTPAVSCATDIIILKKWPKSLSYLSHTLATRKLQNHWGPLVTYLHLGLIMWIMVRVEHRENGVSIDYGKQVWSFWLNFYNATWCVPRHIQVVCHCGHPETQQTWLH